MSEEEDILKNMKNGVYFAHDGRIYQTEFGYSQPVRFATSDKQDGEYTTTIFTAPKTSEWILKDKMNPTADGYYLVYCSNRTMYVANFYSGLDRMGRKIRLETWTPNCECSGTETIENEDILYWMPLPKEPE